MKIAIIHFRVVFYTHCFLTLILYCHENYVPGFWSALKSSLLGIRLALKLVSTCLGSYVPGAVRYEESDWWILYLFGNSAILTTARSFCLSFFTWILIWSEVVSPWNETRLKACIHVFRVVSSWRYMKVLKFDFLRLEIIFRLNHVLAELCFKMYFYLDFDLV